MGEFAIQNRSFKGFSRWIASTLVILIGLRAGISAAGAAAKLTCNQLRRVMAAVYHPVGNAAGADFQFNLIGLPARFETSRRWETNTVSRRPKSIARRTRWPARRPRLRDGPPPGTWRSCR